MPKAPRLKGRELIALLKKMGFEVVRIRGSHHFLQHNDGRGTVVPVHSGEIVGPGLFNKIIRDIDMTKDEFLTFYRKLR